MSGQCRVEVSTALSVCSHVLKQFRRLNFGESRASLFCGRYGVDPKAARTTLLVVDDDTHQLDLRALLLKMAGFTVLTAAGPVEAIAMVVRHRSPRLDLAVLDYEMPMMNGCVLARYLRAHYPELKIILHSGAVEIPEGQSSSINAIVAKGEGVARLLQEISGLLGHEPEEAHSAIGPEVRRYPAFRPI